MLRMDCKQVFGGPQGGLSFLTFISTSPSPTPEPWLWQRQEKVKSDYLSK